MNRQMARGLRPALAAGLLTLGLAACSSGGGGGDDVVITPPPPPPAAQLEDGFGAGFAAAYRAGNTAEPRDPAAGDIIAVNATADPVAIP